jgi:cell filamentation protein
MAGDPYLYPRSSVLKNKQDIRDAEQLRQWEYEATAANTPLAVDYAINRSQLGEAAWRGIHRILFRDVYTWAGNFRTVPLAKAGTAFAPVRTVHGRYADRTILPAFRQAAKRAGNDDSRFAAALAEAWGELNFLHPFREGNGRSTQIFVLALAHHRGRRLDLAKIGRSAEIAAAKQANNGNYVPYQELIERSLDKA